MQAVDPSVVNNVRPGASSRIFSDDNIQTLKDNPNQWFLMASVEGKDNYLNQVRSYNSSAVYFKNKLKNKYNMTIEYKCAQNTRDKSAKLYAILIEEE